jgi:hypothetical protein
LLHKVLSKLLDDNEQDNEGYEVVSAVDALNEKISSGTNIDDLDDELNIRIVQNSPSNQKNLVASIHDDRPINDFPMRRTSSIQLICRDFYVS